MWFSFDFHFLFGSAVTSEIGLYTMSQQQAPINSALTAAWSTNRRQEKIVWRSIHLVVPSHNTWPGHTSTQTQTLIISFKIFCFISALSRWARELSFDFSFILWLDLVLGRQVERVLTLHGEDALCKLPKWTPIHDWAGRRVCFCPLQIICGHSFDFIDSNSYF